MLYKNVNTCTGSNILLRAEYWLLSSCSVNRLALKNYGRAIIFVYKCVLLWEEMKSTATARVFGTIQTKIK
jgi:hypothetical protein